MWRLRHREKINCDQFWGPFGHPIWACNLVALCDFRMKRSELKRVNLQYWKSMDGGTAFHFPSLHIVFKIALCPKSDAEIARANSPSKQPTYLPTYLKARSDVLRKTHQPRLFFTHAKNAAS